MVPHAFNQHSTQVEEEDPVLEQKLRQREQKSASYFKIQDKRGQMTASVVFLKFYRILVLQMSVGTFGARGREDIVPWHSEIAKLNSFHCCRLVRALAVLCTGTF